MKIILISISVIIFLVVIFIFFISSSPKFDQEFFEYSYINKYNSPVELYETYISFLTSRNPKLWEEMVGRKLRENEKLPDLKYKGLPPSIQEYKMEREHATIVTSDGEKIEMDFVKGRWILSQKTPSFYLRKLIRSMKSLIENLLKKFKGEKAEKIVAPSQH